MTHVTAATVSPTAAIGPALAGQAPSASSCHGRRRQRNPWQPLGQGGIAELAQIVRGKNLRNRPIFDRGNRLGYWIRAQVDTVRSLDQQYQP